VTSGIAGEGTRVAWWLLAPTLIVLALVAGWPLARTIWFSLTDAHLADLAQARFIGLENYLARDGGGWFGVLADPLWWRAVRNTFVFALVSVSLETLLGLVIALVLQARFPGRALVRAAVLIPWAIPTIVSAQIWGWMLHDQFGLINDLLLRVDLIDQPLAWTADPSLSMGAVIVADLWKATPFMALLSLAALQLVPGECLDAARVDGAGAWRTFWFVTLPLILPALGVAVLFRSLDALRIFDLIYVLTPGSEDTMSMSVFARQQLVDFQDVGYGSAASSLLFFFIAACTIGFMAVARLRPSQGVNR